ncbi:MAG TPA: DNA gyrase inhibitor YacG [Blastocatellia bacterium]|nr:DNA gyrase inhibitor YacG [Blastocatellia bacterium]
MRCPVCRRETSWEGNEWRPFCSERCQQVDLGRWASEDYRIPVTSHEAEAISPEATGSGDSDDER